MGSRVRGDLLETVLLWPVNSVCLADCRLCCMPSTAELLLLILYCTRCVDCVLVSPFNQVCLAERKLRRSTPAVGQQLLTKRVLHGKGEALEHHLQSATLVCGTGDAVGEGRRLLYVCPLQYKTASHHAHLFRAATCGAFCNCVYICLQVLLLRRNPPRKHAREHAREHWRHHELCANSSKVSVACLHTLAANASHCFSS